jgi:hypothetical protein
MNKLVGINIGSTASIWSGRIKATSRLAIRLFLGFFSSLRLFSGAKVSGAGRRIRKLIPNNMALR